MRDRKEEISARNVEWSAQAAPAKAAPVDDSACADMDAKLDGALENSFPASDPLPWTLGIRRRP